MGKVIAPSFNSKAAWNHVAQAAFVVTSAAALKLYYSTASVNDLRWILAPTALLTELVTGDSFEFESFAGYINTDHTFLIAGSCSGVNFLITSFLMLALAKLWRDRSWHVSWRFIPIAALTAYVVTIIANTVRISAAIQLNDSPSMHAWFDPEQLHRLEGILVYFGFLLLLFFVSERLSSHDGAPSSRLFFPLLIYYAMTLGLPLINGASLQGADFWGHAAFVILIPAVLVLPVSAFLLFRSFRKE